MENEFKISTNEILDVGVIEVWKINGLYYVKTTINSVVKFSDLVNEWKANYFVFHATHYGNMDF